MNNESLGSVSIDTVLNAIEQLKKKELKNISFEYIVASFFPQAYENMQSLLKDTYTQGFIEGRKTI